MMKLTETQIQALYKFTRQHYVYHYDVQSELVDHLANDIEQIWVAEPHLSFEQARDKSFKKFGVFGFMDFIESKQKQMNKRYWKIIWRFMKEWFAIPKVILTLFIFISIFLLLRIPFADYIILGLLVCAMIVELIAVYKIRKKKKKNKEKTFLLEAMIRTSKNGYSGLIFVNIFNFANLTRTDFSQYSIYIQIGFAIVFTLLIILFQVSHYVLPQKAEELLQEIYPEYKFVKNM